MSAFPGFTIPHFLELPDDETIQLGVVDDVKDLVSDLVLKVFDVVSDVRACKLLKTRLVEVFFEFQLL
jgi:hypothetical protein